VSVCLCVCVCVHLGICCDADGRHFEVTYQEDLSICTAFFKTGKRRKHANVNMRTSSLTASSGRRGRGRRTY